MTEPISPAPWMDNIDWESIASRLPADARTEVTSSALPSRSFWILKAAIGASGDSVRSKTRSLMNAQIRRWEASWLQDVKFYADQKGISFEDAFVELALKD